MYKSLAQKLVSYRQLLLLCSRQTLHWLLIMMFSCYPEDMQYNVASGYLASSKSLFCLKCNHDRHTNHLNGEAQVQYYSIGSPLAIES